MPGQTLQLLSAAVIALVYAAGTAAAGNLILLPLLRSQEAIICNRIRHIGVLWLGFVLGQGIVGLLWLCLSFAGVFHHLAVWILLVSAGLIATLKMRAHSETS